MTTPPPDLLKASSPSDDTSVLQIPSRNLIALRIAVGLYLLVSPVSSYNTLAMFGLVESRFVTAQIAITLVMIVFAIIASKPIGHYCRISERASVPRLVWLGSFYVIGPPALYLYYRLRSVSPRASR